MNQNDQQIQSLLDIVKQKKEALVKPEMVFKTNCSFPIGEHNSVNLRTLTKQEDVLKIYSDLFAKKFFHTNACMDMGIETDTPFVIGNSSFEDWHDDFRKVMDMVVFKRKEKELAQVKTSLDNLMSKELKDTIELQKLMILIAGMK